MDFVLRLEIQFLENLRRHVDGLDGIGAVDIFIVVTSILFDVGVNGGHVGLV